MPLTRSIWCALAAAAVGSGFACSEKNERYADAAVSTDADKVIDAASIDSNQAIDAGADAGPDAAPDPLINGCTKGAAVNLKVSSNVTITDTSAWSVSHSACITVSTATVVQWDGNFTVHPLAGGTTPTIDASSPISMAGPGSGTTPITVTFTAPGVYPYFCEVHNASMQGVVYVE